MVINLYDYLLYSFDGYFSLLHIGGDSVLLYVQSCESKCEIIFEL